MSDEIDAVLAEVAPNLGKEKPSIPSDKAAPEPKPEQPDKFDETEYENEDDETFEPEKAAPEARQRWPKKYTNALDRRVQENKELKARLEAIERSKPKEEIKPSEPVEAQKKEYSKEQQAKIDAVLKKQPKLEDFQDYGDFINALTDWKMDVRDAQRGADAEIQAANAKTEQARNEAIAQNEARISKQAKELIEKHPEYLDLLKANADILSEIDKIPHVQDAFGRAEHPELAFIELANAPGAFQRLLQMDATQAALFVGQAQAIGIARMAQEGSDNDGAEAGQNQPEPQRSKAPTPMKAAKGTGRSGKSFDSMDADELDAVLGFSKF